MDVSSILSGIGSNGLAVIGSLIGGGIVSFLTYLFTKTNADGKLRKGVVNGLIVVVSVIAVTLAGAWGSLVGSIVTLVISALSGKGSAQLIYEGIVKRLQDMADGAVGDTANPT